MEAPDQEYVFARSFPDYDPGSVTFCAYILSSLGGFFSVELFFFFGIGYFVLCIFGVCYFVCVCVSSTTDCL